MGIVHRHSDRVETRQKLAHAQPSGADRPLYRGKAGAVIGGAERLGSTAGNGRYAALVRRALSAAGDFLEQRGGDSGHVAGNQQVPGCRGGLQCGEQPTHGAEAGDSVWEYREPQNPISLRVADYDCRSRRLNHQASNARRQRLSADVQKCFIAAHAAAVASGEHEPGHSGHAPDAPTAGGAAPPAHDRILTSALLTICMTPGIGDKQHYGYNRLTRNVGFCFLAAAMACSAAVTTTTESADPTIPRIRSVVRVDPHSHRLVRVFQAVRPAGEPPLRPADPAIQSLVERTARSYDVSPALVHSVIAVESGFNASAVSPKG